MEPLVILIPSVLELLENGLKNQDYLLRDACLFLIAKVANIPGILIFYVFFRIFCDIIDNLTYKLLKQKYIKNWVQLQNKQIHDKLIKLHDSVFLLHLPSVNSSSLDKKERTSLSKKEYSL